VAGPSVLGIDPGQSGGIAFIVTTGTAIPMPKTERDVWEAIQETPIGAHAFIERVHSMPGQGVSSSFKFGQGYGFLRGCLIARGMTFEEVSPAVWQKALGCLSKGDKNVTKARAQQLVPHLKITHAIADSLLIAEYGRRVLAARGAR
jgi:hypothetical protein